MLIGEQCLVGRNILFALQILRAVGAGGSFGLGQLDGIGQLNRCKVGNIFVDGPDESIRIRSVQHLETAVIFTQIFDIISEIGHVAVRLGFQLRAADSQLQRIGNKIERIAHLVLHRRAGADCVEDVVLDLVEVNRLSISQVAHKGRTPEIVVRFSISNCVAVISLCLRFLINLIGQIQSLINGVRIILISIIILGSAVCRCSTVRIFIFRALIRNLFTNLGHPCRPVSRRIVVAIFRAPVIRLSPALPAISIKTPCGNSRLRIIHIGNTITYENQIFPICGNLFILVQQLLACKKSGVGVCSAANVLLDCGFNGAITGSKICKRSYVCLLVEDHNADLDLCFRACRLILQRSKHIQRLPFQISTRGLIQHEYHIRCQRFLCTRQRQRHIGGPGARIQRRCGLGSGNVPLNGVGAAAGGFFRKGPDAVQRKVCGQLLLAGQNRTVILFPAVKGERTVHAVLRTGHAGRNVCNGVFAAIDQRLLRRSGIAFRQVTGNIIRQRVHQRMRRLERNSVRIVFYRDVFVSRFRRPAVDLLKVALTIISRSIPFIPVMIPAGNRKVVRGQNAVAAHVLCIRERKGRVVVEIQVVACDRCGVIVHCAAFSSIDRPLGDCGISKISCKNAAAISGCFIFLHNCADAKVDCDKSVRCSILKVDENTCTILSVIVADGTIFYCDNLLYSITAIAPCHNAAAIIGCGIILNLCIIRQLKLSIARIHCQCKNTCAYICLIFRDHNMVQYHAVRSIGHDAAAISRSILANGGIFDVYLTPCAHMNAAASAVLI